MSAWRIVLAAALTLIGAPVGADDEMVAPGETQFRFLTIEEARDFLGERDEFIEALGPADRLLRFGDADADYAARAVAEAQAWSEDEIATLTEALALFRARLEEAELALPLPEEVLLIKTGGAEEANAGGYTRRNAVILSAGALGQTPEQLVGTLAHELFHVATRFRPELRDPLYAAIGFEPCTLAFPAALESRRVTNPDAFHLEHCIAVAHEGAALIAAPVILYRDPGGAALQSPLDALDVVLLVAGPDGAAAVDAAGEVRLAPIGDNVDYMRKIGRNTGYIIHPEEIVADNFALLVRGAEDVPNPEILRRVASVLAAN